MAREQPNPFRLTHAQWQAQVRELAEGGKRFAGFGWKVHATWTSIHSPRGYPDLTLLKPPYLYVPELKTDSERSKVTDEQQEWVDGLNKVEVVRAFVWRPRQWEEVVEWLQHPR
jgi:hypothetical protein